MGGIVPLAAVVIALFASAFSAVAGLGAKAAVIARADAAAESAALAAALSGDAAAGAAANGAHLVRVTRRGDAAEFEVEVELKGVRARAAARAGAPGAFDALGPAPSRGGGGRRDGLAPETLSALSRADTLLAGAGLPSPVQVVSGYRSVAEQMALWARRDTNPYPVAPPGKSAHNRGMAVDVPRSFVAPLLRVAVEAGLCQPFPGRDPIHFGPTESSECGGRASGGDQAGGMRAVLIEGGHG